MRLQNFLQNGGLGKPGFFASGEGDTIFLDYGNGTTMTITHMGGDLCRLEYHSPRMRLSTALGYMTQFSKLAVLVSPEGGSEANAPWA